MATVGFFASRKESASDDYFLAGRDLIWWIIGGSMIAANISTHHFIGMSGTAYRIGLAIADYNIAQVREALRYDIDAVYFDDDEDLVGLGLNCFNPFQPEVNRPPSPH